MSKKGMRLVAMIEEKENGQYDVVNFLPDITIKHITGKEFEVIEQGDHIKIPYAQGIDDLTVIVGENGVGKTRLVNDIFSLDEKKMFVFKNLDEIDPIYKGKYSYYNFHALNESSYGNNEWKLSFDGARLTDRDYENESVQTVYWGSQVAVNGENYIDWFTRKVAIVKLSNAIESASPWGQGIDLSTTGLLYRGNYDSLLLSDIDKQVKFLLSGVFDAKKIESLISFSGKTLNMVVSEDSLNKVLESNIELGDDRQYLTGLLEFVSKKKAKVLSTIEEKIEFFLTDFFSHVYSSLMPIGFPDDKLDYLGLLKQSDDIFIENRTLVYQEIEKLVEVVKNFNIDVNNYISHRLSLTRDYAKYYYTQKAAYKYHFNFYSAEKRLDILKKLLDDRSQKIIDQIDEFFNYSGTQNDSLLDIKETSLKKYFTIVFEKGELCRYFLKENEQFGRFLDFQLENLRNQKFLKIIGKGRWHREFLLLRELLKLLIYQWTGLSSGQLALLNLFGRLHSLAEEVEGKESILLLLDEVDLGLHPEWQRKWVSTALPIIGEIFKGKHVQIILTTHSPIMLSDIYGENVMMLRKDPETGERQVVYGDEVPSTSFGQNIHQLFKESFFLEQTKGDYSLKIINATIKAVYDLNQEGADVAAIKANFAFELGVEGLSDSKFRAYLEKVMDAIGEKVIAQKLQDMYRTIPLWSQEFSLEGKRAGDLSTEELRQLLRQREEAGQ